MLIDAVIEDTRWQAVDLAALCDRAATATLEAALVKRPMVVAYRMAAFSWWLVLRLAMVEDWGLLEFKAAWDSQGCRRAVLAYSL